MEHAGSLESTKEAPLYNLFFDSFLLICTSFVVRTRGIVCVVYLLLCLANYKDPCKRCVLALSFYQNCISPSNSEVNRDGADAEFPFPGVVFLFFCLI